MATVAFIGLGNMGAGMARRLLQADHDLHVYNRTRSKATELERAGARCHSTPREACMGVDAVFAMTADDTSSRSVWLGPDGVLAANLAPRAFAIECSTLSHDWVLELATAARAQNLRYLDAPVTGLPDAAAAGSLTLLVGADAKDLESARPLLTAVGDRILHFGTVGSGTAYKLIVNLLGAVQIASLAEGMALAEKAGLNLATVANGPGRKSAGRAQRAPHRRRRSRSERCLHAGPANQGRQLRAATREQAWTPCAVRPGGGKPGAAAHRSGLFPGQREQDHRSGATRALTAIADRPAASRRARCSPPARRGSQRLGWEAGAAPL